MDAAQAMDVERAVSVVFAVAYLALACSCGIGWVSARALYHHRLGDLFFWLTIAFGVAFLWTIVKI